MSANKKVEEGLEHIKTAEKCLKTSLLKWRPDYEEAADEYNKAATCFRIAKSLKQCRDCLMKASDCYRQNRNPFYAAKAIDQIVLVCKELGDFNEIAQMAEKAANLFHANGNAESAAASLDKAAKILEQHYPEQALSLFQHAAEIATIQDSSRQAAEYVSKVARLQVKLHQYDLAADSIRREMCLHQQHESYQQIGRLAVALVLVQLARGDVVAAEKAFKEWGNCCEGPEVQLLEQLLTAYDEEDPDAAKAALGNPFIKHMDVEYAILARHMPLPEGIAVPQAGSSAATANRGVVREGAADEYVSPSTAGAAASSTSGGPGNAADDDEEEGGLC